MYFYKTKVTIMKNISLIILSVIIITACSKQQSSQDAIRDLESKVFTDSIHSTIDKAICEELLTSYDEYANEYTTDSLATIYLYKAGQLCIASHQYQRATEYFTRIEKRFPSWYMLPEVLFVKGFVYENHLKDLDKAKATYERMIAKYPTSSYADDAQMCINMLGVSTEQLIDSFEKGDTVLRKEN